MLVVSAGELVRVASDRHPGPRARAAASELPLAAAGRTAQADPGSRGPEGRSESRGILGMRERFSSAARPSSRAAWKLPG